MSDIILNNEDSIQYIKYMGSKTKILPFVLSGIQKIYTGGVCDLFAGSGSLAGALSNQVPIISNDIQEYSSILAKTYLTDWNDGNVRIDLVLEKAREYHQKYYIDFIHDYQYPSNLSLEEFNSIEKKSQNLIYSDFNNKWHLFTKNYSGTWWSTEQCTWIDSLRKSIEDFKDSTVYNTLLSSLMYAVAYNSQGTGHYAQYRDAKTISSMTDISKYRSKSILDFFVRKANESLIQMRTSPNHIKHSIISKDYLDCLENVKGYTVYADPPYCFVHYSRFYHALETLILYDFPELQTKNGEVVKGRYRTNRHQSPFCIKTQVESAFLNMFSLIKKNNCSLALSYSNTGMISIERIIELANNYFKNSQLSLMDIDYTHMTMGRKEDRDREVKEMLLLIKKG